MQEQFAEEINCLKAKSENQICLTFVAFFDAKGLIHALLKSIDVQSKVSHAVSLETSLELSLCFGKEYKQSKVLSFANHCRAQKREPEHEIELRTKNPVTRDLPVEISD